MKHVLITGGAGFIGSHLCDLFLARGYAVTAVDNLVTGRRENLREALKNRNFDFVEADVCGTMQEETFRLVQEHGLSGVLHFACPASPVDFEKIPFVILEVDSIGTMKMIDLALRYDCRFLVASTSEVYGDPLEHPQREEYRGNVSTTGPRACYDEAKRFAEAAVTSAVRSGKTLPGVGHRKLRAGIVRIFNTYGPRMRPDDGRLAPELCMQALRGQPLTIHGDGRQTRSFCFVSDLVDGVLRLFESNETHPVNIGNPSECTILEFAKIARDLAGGNSPIEYLPPRADDPRRRCPDISRARQLLGWNPAVDLEAGMRRTLEYFKSFL